MYLRFLGTSGFGITTKRNLPSILIDEKILFDCGEGCLKSLLNYDIDITGIEAIFISHLHHDHINGLFSILFKLAFYQNKEIQKITEIQKIQDIGENRVSPPIYVPIGMKKNLKSLIDLTFCSFENVNFKVQIIELPINSTKPLIIEYDRGKYEIEWIKSIHSPICYSYKVNNKLLITNDTAPNEKLYSFGDKCEIIVSEATFFDEKSQLAHKLNHSTPIDGAKLAKIVNSKKLILTHVPDLSPGDVKKFLKLAKKIFQDVSVAQDGDLIKI